MITILGLILFMRIFFPNIARKSGRFISGLFNRVFVPIVSAAGQLILGFFRLIGNILIWFFKLIAKVFATVPSLLQAIGQLILGFFKLLGVFLTWLFRLTAGFFHFLKARL